MLSFCFNACLSIDMFLTFKNPFYPSGRRTKFYIIGSIIFVCIFSPYFESPLLNDYDFFTQYI